MSGWAQTSVLVAAVALSSGAACTDGKTMALEVDGHPLTVELARTPEERAKGLMYRDSLPAHRGMLFVYPSAEPRSFWMKNTRIPLSIAYIDATGAIVSLHDLRPLSTESVPSAAPAQYALEVNRGWFAEHGVEVGDRVAPLPSRDGVK